nr:methyltransferase domain-containing protein [Nostoc sp. ChiQUE02]MDZ8234390.1 methyltransferase domain-containing protein [Nostoc sp. ChiQUE02]
MDYNKRFTDFRESNFSWIDLWVFKNEKEILDLEPNSERAVRVVNDLDRFSRLCRLNRLLIGQISQQILRIYEQEGRPPKIIDICTGYGGFSRDILEWSRDMGVPLQITGIDKSSSIIHEANNLSQWESINFKIADATRLPFQLNEFDLAINIQSLHHFEPELVICVLREAARVARSLFFFDLRRTPYGFVLIHLFSPFFSSEFIHDGKVSHRRAYSEAEMRFLVKEAGINAVVKPFSPVGLIIETY